MRSDSVPRAQNIETENLVLICLLPDEVEALLKSDWMTAQRLIGVEFAGEDHHESHSR